MITNTTARMTYTFTEGITEYAVGFVYQTNPDNSPQIKVYVNDAVNTPLTYGTDYTMSLDGTKVVIASGVEVGDTLTIIRNIPIVQLSDYVIGRIDPEQIEKDFDLCVERDQQQSARITVTEEQLAAHDERIAAVEEVVPETATSENLLATMADIPTVGNGTITITQGGTTKGTFTTNQSGNTTVALDAGGSGAVDSVNGKTGVVVLDASDVGALSDSTVIPTVNNPTITFTQGGVSKGSITLNQSSTQTIAFDAGGGGSGAVDSVNGKTGVVVLTASDVGALPSSTVIPDAQIQSNWNQSDNTKVDYIKNKPTIPTVNDSTIQITQGGVSKGSFTLNQASGATIALDAGSGSGSLSGLSDVTLTTPSSGQVLSYDGSKWVNETTYAMQIVDYTA